MATKKKDAEVSFEQAQARMREIVEALEDPSLPLEESMKLFEEGSKLAKFCQQLLDRAEKRIDVLVGGSEGTGSGADAQTEPLEDPGLE